MKIELGISTFGETTPLEKTGKTIPHDERIRQMVAEIELADKVGLDVYAIGEHHRDDFAVSAPEIVMAAGAVNTKNIKLSSAVTVLSSNDPVRVYQNFSTVDALSNGRAEIMVGRGSFTESFPLFGYTLDNYDELFTEKLDMLEEIKANEILDWKGKLTQSVDRRGVYPRHINLPIWVATGGNGQSTLQTAYRGLPIIYAIIGGNPFAFKYLVDAYKETFKSVHGDNLENMQVGAHSWGYIDNTTEEAVKKYYYPTKIFVDRIAKDRSSWRELSKEAYEHMVSEEGAMMVGSPELVAKKIIKLVEGLGLTRFLIHLPVGSLPHEDVLNSIKLFGEKVAPIVREYFKNK
ncbi:LLM class flavin-dependent oxidoreductase [Mycoplasma sp. CSL7475-4]|uniref:LLM class flavin-dependent oxidoreductase n=1 Tax=Mycoplasma sp. CSL7475-4 TaxID=2973942 RepID=UPI00216AD4CB|nr:LLM class flavin-dependent oxidoreductase [Mycoplasma sp. CSL7475-4]MCS4536640.1 LLM class flavin-dependent oxidoreductase [Mycoplasma sp. CSL7475-4]